MVSKHEPKSLSNDGSSTQQQASRPKLGIAARLGIILFVFSGAALFSLWPEIGVGPDQGAGIGLYCLLLLGIFGPLLLLAIALIVIGLICDAVASSKSAKGAKYAPLKYPLPDPITPKSSGLGGSQG